MSLQKGFASLRLYGPDQKGIVAACSRVLDKFGCGIVQSETWTDRIEHLFFQRVLFDYDHHYDHHYNYHKTDTKEIHPEIKMAMNDEMMELHQRFGLCKIDINWRTKPKKVAVFVSKYDHCLVSMCPPWLLIFQHPTMVQV